MTDPFSITVGIVGLLPLCQSGYQMIRDVIKSAEDATDAIIRLDLQRNVFDEWKDTWSDPSVLSSLPVNTAQRIYRQLTAICGVFSDAESLERSFGFRRTRNRNGYAAPANFRTTDVITQANIDNFRNLYEVSLSFISRCKFVFQRGNQKWKDLIELLKEYNGNLNTLRPIGSAVWLSAMISRMNQDLIRAAQSESNDSSELGMMYRNLCLASMFKFRQRQETAAELERVPKFTRDDIRFSPNYIIRGRDGNEVATLARLRTVEGRPVVLIEWVNLQGMASRANDAVEISLLLKKFRLEILLLPSSFGIFADDDNYRIGIVLSLPSAMGQLPDGALPGAISVERMPENLDNIIRDENRKGTDLGFRFKLARRLANAVHIMHVVGFVHKNIRSSSVFFFPRLDTALDKPVFAGFNHFHGKIPAKKSDLAHSQEGEEEEGEVEGYPSSDEEGEHQQLDIHLDYYQHPDKRHNTSIRYQPHHDLYSLGCLLLEIGLWKTIEEIVDIPEELDIDEMAMNIRNLASTDKLDSVTGAIYGNFVRWCLNATFAEHSLEEEQRRFSSLEICAA